ncbi:MAG: hypothetical protein ACOYLX_18265 [Burkholderiaceae bacterium]
MPGIAYSRPADAADLAPSAQHVVVSSATHAALRELLGSNAGLLTSQRCSSSRATSCRGAAWSRW